MTNTMTQHELVLMHEMAHAYVAEQFGLTVTYVELDEDEDDGLGGWTRVGEGQVTWQQQMQLFMAGLAGEQLALGTEKYEPHEGTLQDIAGATQALMRVMPDATAEQASEALEYAFWVALDMLQKAGK